MPESDDEFIGVGGVALPPAMLLAFIGVLTLAYAARIGMVKKGALALGAIMPCMARKYAIRGTVTFPNGADRSVTVCLQGRPDCHVSVDAPQYEFTELLPGNYRVYSPATEHYRAHPLDQSVTIDAGDVGNIDFTVTFKAPTEVHWRIASPITYGTALDPAHLNASLMRTGTDHTVDGTPTYTYQSGKPLNDGNHTVEPGKVLKVGDILPAGTHMLQVSFTVADEPLFCPPEPATARVVVAQARPVVAFRNQVNKQYDETVEDADLYTSATFNNKDVEGKCEIPAGATQKIGSETLTVRFKPTDKQNFMTVPGNVAIIVAKRQLQIVWADPADIDYGTPLSGTQLNARLEPEVSKAIVYDPVGGVERTGGTWPLKASYNVTKQQVPYYLSPQDKTVSLTVRPVAPVLTAAPPAELNMNALLAQHHINASARFRNVDVPGVFTYAPIIGPPLNAGVQNVTVGFVPTDAATYLSTVTTVATLNVLRVTTAQRQTLHIDANAEQHILRGDVNVGAAALDGAHSPTIRDAAGNDLAGYRTQNVVVSVNGVRSMDVAVNYGTAAAPLWTGWKTSTLPPADWDDDMFWDATRQTLLAAPVQDPLTHRWTYTANVPNPNPPYVAIRWKVIHTPLQDRVITSYPCP